MNYINFVYLSTYLSSIHTDDINERYAYSTFQGICLPIGERCILERVGILKVDLRLVAYVHLPPVV